MAAKNVQTGRNGKVVRNDGGKKPPRSQPKPKKADGKGRSRYGR